MTTKEFNKIRTAAFDAAMEIPEVADAVKTAGMALIYDLKQLPDKHEVIVLTARTQLNDSTLMAHGFSPDKVDASLVMTFNGATKCATF